MSTSVPDASERSVTQGQEASTSVPDVPKGSVTKDEEASESLPLNNEAGGDAVFNGHSGNTITVTVTVTTSTGLHEQPSEKHSGQFRVKSDTIAPEPDEAEKTATPDDEAEKDLVGGSQGESTAGLHHATEKEPQFESQDKTLQPAEQAEVAVVREGPAEEKPASFSEEERIVEVEQTRSEQVAPDAVPIPQEQKIVEAQGQYGEQVTVGAASIPPQEKDFDERTHSEQVAADAAPIPQEQKIVEAQGQYGEQVAAGGAFIMSPQEKAFEVERARSEQVAADAAPIPQEQKIVEVQGQGGEQVAAGETFIPQNIPQKEKAVEVEQARNEPVAPNAASKPQEQKLYSIEPDPTADVSGERGKPIGQPVNLDRHGEEAPELEPREETRVNPDRSVRRPSDPQRTARKKVLLIEDDLALLQLLELAFARYGYDCLTAENGRAAQEILQTHRPDVILLDLLMPVMDGVAFIQWLRESFHDSRTPVLVFSTLGNPNTMQQLKRCGADFFIHKPVKLRDLVEAMNKLAGLADTEPSSVQV